MDAETLQRLAADQPDLTPPLERLLADLANVTGLCAACEGWLAARPDLPGPVPGAELLEVLAGCPDCCGLGAALGAALAAEAEAPEPAFDARRLSFLRPRTGEAPWECQVSSRLLGAETRLTFACDPAYLWDLLEPLARGQGQAGEAVSAPRSVCLLDARQRLGSAEVRVQLQAEATAAAGVVALACQVESSEALPPGLHAWLQWDSAHQHAAPLVAGSMSLLGPLVIGPRPALPAPGGARAELMIAGWQ